MNKIVKEYNQSGMVNNQVVTNEFVQAIKQWVQYDDAIKDANKKLKEYRDKKTKLGKGIAGYMTSNHIENYDINITGGGKVTYRTSNRMVPVNEAYVYRRLLDYFAGDEKKARYLTDFIYKERERTTSSTLSRTRPRRPN